MAGLSIGVALGLSIVATIVLAVTLGFVFGFGLGLIPLMKAKFLLKDAIRQVLIAEGLSIAVMETAEVLVEVYTPGVMAAGLASWTFWEGMLLALTAGFIAAFPVNYVLAGRGIRHIQLIVTIQFSSLLFNLRQEINYARRKMLCNTAFLGARP